MNFESLRLRAGMAVIAVTAAAAPLSAQARFTTTAPWQAGVGVAHESYTFATPEAVGIESLELLTVPFVSSARLWGNARLTATGYHATGTLTRSNGESTTISGLTDSHLTLDVPLVRDLINVSLVAALPTGTATFTREEAETAGAFAADLLPFRVSHWGSGGALGAAAMLVRSLGPVNLGLSAGYSAAREFQPLSGDELTYRPGNELALRFAIDRTFGRSAKASLQLAAQTYDGDELAGQNLYQSGNRYSAIASTAFATGARASTLLYAGVLRREQGGFLDAASGELLPGNEVPAQDLILAGARLRLPAGAGTLVPQADGRLFRREDGVGQGYVSSLGLGYELPLGGMRITPQVKGRIGQLIARSDMESKLTGLETAVSVRFGGAR